MTGSANSYRLILFSDKDHETLAVNLQSGPEFTTFATLYSLKYALVRAIYGHLETVGANVITITED